MKLFAGNILRRKPNKRRNKTHHRTLRMESLEDRRLLAVVTLNPVKDNTLIGELLDVQGQTSNGLGSIFVGLNNEQNRLRRGLVDFDVAGSVPAGSTINSVTLTMWVNRTHQPDVNVELHKVLANWGEAGSSGRGPGGPAQTGDATWLHTFFATQFWTKPGGDFTAAASGVTLVGPQNAFYTWSSTAQMVTDVQGWLNNPGTDFGWLLKANETVSSSHRFDSRESATVAHRPLLTIDYTPPAPASTLAIAATDAVKLEGNAGSTPFTFTVTRTGDTSGTTTVSYAVTGSGVAAASAADFAGGALPTGSVTFNATETSKMVTVNVNGDTAVESNETFTVTLSNAVGGTITTATAGGTIANDDGVLASVALNPLKDNTLIQDTLGSLSNGAGDVFVGRIATGNVLQRGLMAFDVAGDVSAGAVIQSVTLTLYVSRTQVGDRTIGLHKASADWGEAQSSGSGIGGPAQSGDATWLHTFYDSQFWLSPGGDFSATESAVQTVGAQDAFYTWNSTPQMVADVQEWLDHPGSNFGWVLKGDETQQSSKRFGSRESAVAAQRPLLTIHYATAPPLPGMSIGDATLAEGNSGTVNAGFDVTLSAASAGTVTVSFAAAAGTAVAGADYQASSGTLTFAPGETVKTITVPVKGDAVVELNETFFVNLSDAQNATIVDAQGLGTITDDDSAGLSINDVTRAEGNAGTTAFTFTVTLGAAVDVPVSVDFSTADGTATTADGDYAAASGTLTFAGSAGETKTITVNVNGDQKIEPNETFLVSLANAVAGGRSVTLAKSQGVGTITDDDSIASGVRLQGGVLQIVGTNQDDRVSIRKWRGTQVLVVASFLGSPGSQVFKSRDVKRIDVKLYDGNDSAEVDRNVKTPVVIDGGPGNDVLRGGGGQGVLYGGEGDDRLFGGSGYSSLFGGEGNDLLFGGSGPGVLVGGSGNDELNAGSRRSILIGGEGQDKLKGSCQDDILIGGRTTYDANEAALLAILAEWNSSRRFAARVQNLTAGVGPDRACKLKLGDTVLDDLARDVLYGGKGNNWFLAFGDDNVVDREKKDS